MRITFGILAGVGGGEYSPGNPLELETSVRSRDYETLQAKLAMVRERLSRSDEQGAPVHPSPPEPQELSPVVQLRVLDQPVDQQAANVFVPAIRGGKLTHGFFSVFGLTPEETSVLEKVVEDRNDEIYCLSAANANVDHREESIVIAVEPFVEGVDVYETVMGAFQDTLGPDRFAAYERLDPHRSLSREFAEFGVAVRTLTIARMPGEEQRFLIRNQRQSLGGGASGMRTEFSDPQELPER